MIGHEDQIAGMNPFQRLNDQLTLKPTSDAAFAVHLPVLIERSTRQLNSINGPFGCSIFLFDFRIYLGPLEASVVPSSPTQYRGSTIEIRLQYATQYPRGRARRKLRVGERQEGKMRKRIQTLIEVVRLKRPIGFCFAVCLLARKED